MKRQNRHRWDLTPRQAIALQERLRRALDAAPVSVPPIEAIRLVAGVDVAYSQPRRHCYASAVVLSFPDLEILEERSVASEAVFPYVPGLLSFREAPALAAALRQVRHSPDALLCDGQGLAHMRRFGLATHLGWLYGLPSVGCAKSRLIGEFRPPGRRRGAWSDLMDRGEKVGEVVRTRDGVSPLFVSPGHRMTFELARRLTLACCDGRRLPEPTRLAHLATRRLLRADQTDAGDGGDFRPPHPK